MSVLFTNEKVHRSSTIFDLITRRERNFSPYYIRDPLLEWSQQSVCRQWYGVVVTLGIPLSRVQRDFHCNSAGSRPIKINHLSRIIIRLFAGNMTTSSRLFIMFLTFAAVVQTYSYYLPKRVSWVLFAICFV